MSSATTISLGLVEITPENEKAEIEKIENHIKLSISQGFSLEILGGEYPSNEFNGDRFLKGIYFRNVAFLKPLTLGGIEDGAAIIFENCTFQNFFPLRVEGVRTNTFLFENCTFPSAKVTADTASEDLGGMIIVSNSVIESAFFKKCLATIEFSKTSINKKLHLSALGNSSRKVDLYLNESELNCYEFLISHSKIDYFKICDSNSDIPSGAFFSVCSKIENFWMLNTKAPKYSFGFDGSYSGRINIDSSEIGDIDISASLASDSEKNKMNSISIRSSSIGEINACGRCFENPLDFTDTKFKKSPKFHGVDIPQGSIFPVHEFYYDKNGENTIRAYRTLRLAMEAQRAREEEGVFYQLEQESILNTRVNGSKCFHFSFWYRLLSSFGTDYRRPLVILLCLLVSFSAIYSLLLSPVLGFRYDFDINVVVKGFVFSIKQMIYPFSALRSNDINNISLYDEELYLGRV